MAATDTARHCLALAVVVVAIVVAAIKFPLVAPGRPLPTAEPEAEPEAATAAAEAPPAADATRYYTSDELRNHDGSNKELPLMLSLGGIVFDVTEGGTEFYAKGAAYNCFAGRVCGRALAMGSLEQADIDLGEEIDDLSDNELQE